METESLLTFHLLKDLHLFHYICKPRQPIKWDGLDIDSPVYQKENEMKEQEWREEKEEAKESRKREKKWQYVVPSFFSEFVCHKILNHPTYKV